MPSNRNPFKVGVASDVFAAVLAGQEAAATDTADAPRQIMLGPWRAYAQAVGLSAPANVNRTTRAIRAIKGSTR
jgi:hypothetical protein